LLCGGSGVTTRGGRGAGADCPQVCERSDRRSTLWRCNCLTSSCLPTRSDQGTGAEESGQSCLANGPGGHGKHCKPLLPLPQSPTVSVLRHQLLASLLLIARVVPALPSHSLIARGLCLAASRRPRSQRCSHQEIGWQSLEAACQARPTGWLTNTPRLHIKHGRLDYSCARLCKKAAAYSAEQAAGRDII